MRHGESESNIKHLLSSSIGQFGDRLTPEGKKQIKDSTEKLKDIDIIISSPFVRTTESAEIIAEILGKDKKEIIFQRKIRA